MIDFVVKGTPQPAGSKKNVPVRRFPVTVASMRDLGRSFPLIDDNDRAKGWKKTIAAAARDAMDGSPPLGEQLSLMLVFALARPKSHYRTGKYADELRADAPTRPTTKPDVLKLARAVEDALTGIVYTDDSLIVFETISKRYGDPSVQIFVDHFDEATSQLRMEVQA